MNNIVLVPTNQLKTHEATCLRRVMEIMDRIRKDGYIRNPVVADKKTLVVLDGHHRLAALKKLGARKIPVLLVDYRCDQIKVYLRRKNLLMDLIKQAVIKRALGGQIFPYKSTRHYLKYRPRNINLKIHLLLIS